MLAGNSSYKKRSSKYTGTAYDDKYICYCCNNNDMLYTTGSCIPNSYFRMSYCYFRTLYLVNILINDLTHVWSYDRY